MKVRALLLGLGLAFLAFFILPNEFYKEDMIIHVPFIKQQTNPSLYPKDDLLEGANPQQSSSLYYPLMSLLFRVSPLTFANTYSVIKIIYFTGLFVALLLLTEKITNRLYQGFLLIFLLLTRFHVGGSAVRILESEVLPRAIGIMSLLWAVYFLLRKQKVVSGLILGFTFLIHPLTFIYVCLFALWKRITLDFKNLRPFITFTVIIFLLAILFFFVGLWYRRIPEEWLDILRVRNSYAFIHLWSLKSWASLILLIFPGVLFSVVNRKEYSHVKNIFLLTLSGSIFFTLVHLLFAIVYPTPFIISLQLGRMWLFPVLVSLFCTTVHFFNIVKGNILRVGGIFLIFLFIVFYQNHVSRKDVSSWLDIQRWVKNNTELNCTFLTPFFETGFRTESERSIVGEYKDGALSFYSEKFAKTWYQKYQDVKNWETFSEEELFNLQKKYQFDFLVTQKSIMKEFPMIYENNEYRVYDMRKNRRCES